MTMPTIDLDEFLGKTQDADFLREMVSFAAQRLMELEWEGRCGAGYGERSEERTNHRNGYRERRWDTRAGTIDLQIPKLRQGSYFASFLDPRRVGEKALVAVIQKAYITGVSTRSVNDLVKSLGMAGVSKIAIDRRRRSIRRRSCGRQETTEGSLGSARRSTRG